VQKIILVLILKYVLYKKAEKKANYGVS